MGSWWYGLSKREVDDEVWYELVEKYAFSDGSKAQSGAVTIVGETPQDVILALEKALESVKEEAEEEEFGVDNKLIYSEALPPGVVTVTTHHKISFFDRDGNKLLALDMSDYHEQECCEQVYAEWDGFLNREYHAKDAIACDEAPKEFSRMDIYCVEDAGILIHFAVDGEQGTVNKVFVPCHDIQNGYYSSDLRLDIARQNECGSWETVLSKSISSAVRHDHSW